MKLIVHHLQFHLRALTPIHLGPQAGAQIRGALWAALRQFACAAPFPNGDPAHSQHCPMCRLMALETASAARGVNPPRPFAVRPPLPSRPGSGCAFMPDDLFGVGVNLFGDAVDLFPYVVQAFYRMGQIGVGYGRGQFTLDRVEAVNPLDGATSSLLHDTRFTPTPGLPVTSSQIRCAASGLPADYIRLRFLTPMQITQRGRSLLYPSFEGIIGRLLERCQAMAEHYTDSPDPQFVWRDRYLSLVDVARQIDLVRDQTRWASVESGSRRTGTRNTISGFMGEATYEGNASSLREWLLWGQSLHVGKNAVKGNGWFEIVSNGDP